MKDSSTNPAISSKYAITPNTYQFLLEIKNLIQICQSCQQNLQKMFKNPSDMRCGICLALFSLFLHNKSLVTAESVQVRSNTLFLVPLLTRNRGVFSASDLLGFFYTFQLKPKPTSNIIGKNTQRQGDRQDEMKPTSSVVMSGVYSGE